MPGKMVEYVGARFRELKASTPGVGRSDDVCDNHADKRDGFKPYIDLYNTYTGKNLNFDNDIVKPFDQPRGIDYGKLTQAANDLQKVGTDFAASRDAMNSKVAGVVGSSWQGDAANAFGAYTQQFDAKAQSIDGDLAKLSQAITASSQAAQKIVDAYGHTLDQIDFGKIAFDIPDLVQLIVVYKCEMGLDDLVKWLKNGLADLIGFTMPGGALFDLAMDVCDTLAEALLWCLSWAADELLQAVAGLTQKVLDAGFKDPFEQNLQLLQQGSTAADNGIKQAFQTLITAAEAVNKTPFSGLSQVPEGGPTKTGGGGGGHTGGGGGGGGGSMGGGGGGSMGGGGGAPTQPQSVQPPATPQPPQVPQVPQPTTPQTAQTAETVKIHDGANDIDVTSPDGQGHVKIKVDTGDGKPAKTYDVDFSKVAANPAVAGLAGQPGTTGQGGVPGQGGLNHPGMAGQGGIPGQAGVPGQGGLGQPGMPGHGGPGQPGMPGQGGVPGQTGVPIQGGVPGQPAANPDGSIPTPTGADGKAVIHDGDLTITAQQGKVPGEVQVSIDDGSGKPPHTYTIDYNNADGPAASPTHEAADPGQPDIGPHPTNDQADQPTPDQPASTGAHALDEPPAHDAAWTPPDDTASTGPQHALPDDTAMPDPATWTAPAAADSSTYDFVATGDHDQGSISGSLFDPPAATTVASASFTSGAHVDTGGQGAWSLGTEHSVVGDQGGHHSAWDTAHAASAPAMTQPEQASAPGDAGLAQIGGGAHQAAAPPMSGGMPMMGAMGGGGHGGGGEDQERSTNAAWRTTPGGVFDDTTGAPSVARMNGVLGDDEGSQRQ